MAEWGGPYNNLYMEALPKRISLSNGEALPKRIPLSIQNCTFSTFDMDKLKKPMERTPLN